MGFIGFPWLDDRTVDRHHFPSDATPSRAFPTFAAAPLSPGVVALSPFPGCFRTCRTRSTSGPCSAEASVADDAVAGDSRSLLSWASQDPHTAQVTPSDCEQPVVPRPVSGPNGGPQGSWPLLAEPVPRLRAENRGSPLRPRPRVSPRGPSARLRTDDLGRRHAAWPTPRARLRDLTRVLPRSADLDPHAPVASGPWAASPKELRRPHDGFPPRMRSPPGCRPAVTSLAVVAVGAGSPRRPRGRLPLRQPPLLPAAAAAPTHCCASARGALADLDPASRRETCPRARRHAPLAPPLRAAKHLAARGWSGSQPSRSRPAPPCPRGRRTRTRSRHRCLRPARGRAPETPSPPPARLAPQGWVWPAPDLRDGGDPASLRGRRCVTGGRCRPPPRPPRTSPASPPARPTCPHTRATGARCPLQGLRGGVCGAGRRGTSRRRSGQATS